MASESADPPSPQSQVVTASGPNQTARINAYTDRALTKRNVVSTPAPSDLPPPSGSRTLGNIRPVYSSDRVEERNSVASNPGAPVPPHSPNKWARGTVDGKRVSRDPYANKGMVGQNFFNNQG